MLNTKNLPLCNSDDGFSKRGVLHKCLIMFFLTYDSLACLRKLEDSFKIVFPIAWAAASPTCV